MREVMRFKDNKPITMDSLRFVAAAYKKMRNIEQTTKTAGIKTDLSNMSCRHPENTAATAQYELFKMKDGQAWVLFSYGIQVCSFTEDFLINISQRIDYI